MTLTRPLLVAAIAVLIIGATGAAAEDVTFTFEPLSGMDVESVSLRGSFNDWGETALVEGDDGVWSVTIQLDPGEYQYKYFVNGEWPGDMSTWLGGEPADSDAEDYADDGHGGQNAVRVVGGAATEEAYEEAPPLADNVARIHYHRPAGGYGGWGLHAWEDIQETVTWTEPLEPTGRDPFGVYWDLHLTDGAEKVGFIVHRGDAKDPGPDMFLNLSESGNEVWLVSGRSDMQNTEPDVTALALGDLTRQRAHWVDRNTIAWRVRYRDGDTARLHFSEDGALELTADGMTGGESLELTRAGELSAAVKARFPHLAGYAAFRLSDGDAARAHELLKGQVAVSVSDPDGRVKNATGVQIPGVLDDLFLYDGPLGVTWNAGAPTFSVWAPTAQQVWVHIYETSASPEPLHVLGASEENGVWTLAGRPEWKNMFYLYEVQVYVPATMRVERNVVTDPYSRSLSTNSRRSQIIDLDDPALAPEGWDDVSKPDLEAPEDIVLYELHVRDFSANDPSCPPELTGTYMAFTADSRGTDHLRTIAAAGVSHVHILPAFDIASVDEDKSTWETPGDLSQYAPDSEEQQAAVARVRDRDAYNWGYDPFHYGVPEGSYSTDPDGPARVLEFREMVKALSEMGLRVVMDVVYNHTHASGVEDASVLDKVVPGYYHRLNQDGFVENSTCCQNTATEHAMMERLMIDDLVHWARDYKIDGFRFDLMGHHMKSNMVRAREALHGLTTEADGVDGSSMYIYGEGWDFGEVQGGKRGVNATQVNMAGTGIGTFNDRLRNAVRGGSAFGDRREQGFATGLFVEPSGFNRSGSVERANLLKASDRVRIGLAGNLRAFRFTDHTGRAMTGGQFEGVGYTADPEETINYVSAHDNETFFDKIQYSAAADVTLADRVRMQNLAVSLTALGQGIPFFHAGVELLRSKSMEADSYNAGDWFNRLDWSYRANNFGVGLPSAEKNRDRWNIIKPILGRGDITPGEKEIRASLAHFTEMLKIRRSTPLLRLRTASDVQGRVAFHNTGPQQQPGVIVMSISDTGEGLPVLDPDVRRLVAVVNARPDATTFGSDIWRGAPFELHPVLADSDDEVVRASSFDVAEGRFTVPGRTTAVFLERR